jgi:hypothetical protein
MKPPHRIRALDLEVETWTENISEEALGGLSKLFLGGFGGSTVITIFPVSPATVVMGPLFHRPSLPRSFRYNGKRVATDRFLAPHEVVEKALRDQLRLHYVPAHQIALQTGRLLRYFLEGFSQVHRKLREEDRCPVRVPKDLDLTPYRDEDISPNFASIIAAS